jgi:hypothetical protein
MKYSFFVLAGVADSKLRAVLCFISIPLPTPKQFSILKARTEGTEVRILLLRQRRRRDLDVERCHL